MYKRRLKSCIGLFLMVFMTAGLAISTLHSHHKLEWHHHHPEDFADTGNCISPDTSACPICGYLFTTEVPTDNFSESVLLPTEQLSLKDELLPFFIFEVVNKGRSPPAIA